MKNGILLFAFFVLTLSDTFGQQISNKQWTLIHERSASWCPFCGTWGWDMKDSILANFSDEPLLFMAVHHSGDLVNNTSSEFGMNFNGVGQPIFYENGQDLDVNSSNIQESIENIGLILDFNKEFSPFAGVGIDAVVNTDQDSLLINARVEFVTEVENGEYYLALYLLEDLVSFQQSRGSNAQHKNVLQSSLLGGTFGKFLVKGSVAEGTEFFESVKIPNFTKDPSKIKIAGVIWSKPENKYRFFNANVVKPSAISSTADLAFNTVQMKAFQNESGNISVLLDSNEPIHNAKLQLVDINGKIVSVQDIHDFQGQKSVELPVKDITGMVIVNLSNGKAQKSVKVLIQN